RRGHNMKCNDIKRNGTARARRRARDVRAALWMAGLLLPPVWCRHAAAVTYTAADTVDLNPSFLRSNPFSVAYGTFDSQQVGYGSGGNTTYAGHALLWTGTAASAVDLNPASLLGGGSASKAYATNGAQQVGYGSGVNTSSYTHALLWTGTAASAIDLHPA